MYSYLVRGLCPIAIFSFTENAAARLLQLFFKLQTVYPMLLILYYLYYSTSRELFEDLTKYPTNYLDSTRAPKITSILPIYWDNGWHATIRRPIPS
jgi:hypothetical protein